MRLTRKAAATVIQSAKDHVPVQTLTIVLSARTSKTETFALPNVRLQNTQRMDIATAAMRLATDALDLKTQFLIRAVSAAITSSSMELLRLV